MPNPFPETPERNQFSSLNRYNFYYWWSNSTYQSFIMNHDVVQCSELKPNGSPLFEKPKKIPIAVQPCVNIGTGITNTTKPKPSTLDFPPHKYNIFIYLHLHHCNNSLPSISNMLVRISAPCAKWNSGQPHQKSQLEHSFHNKDYFDFSQLILH